MKFTTFNCLNIKSNLTFVKKLALQSDILYVCEHWLGPNEDYILNDFLGNDFVYYFRSDMEEVRQRGRPHGGICWIIRKNINIISFEFLNEIVSMLNISIQINNSPINMKIFGVWFPFDDKSLERIASFKQGLSIIESNFFGNDDHFIIMGDFNSF